MIFIFPALASENIDKNVLPAITKSLEQYFLIHLLTAISMGHIRIDMRINQKTGKIEKMVVESNEYLTTNLNFLQEAIIELYDNDVILEQNPNPSNPQNPNPQNSNRPPTVNVTVKSGGDKKSSEPAKIDTFKDLSLYPTMVVTEIEVWRNLTAQEIEDRTKEKYDQSGIIDYNSRKFDITKKIKETRKILIGVKVATNIIKNFDDLYNALRKDYYSNIFVYTYKSAVRTLIRTAYNFKGIAILRRLIGKLTKSSWEDLGWYGQTLLSKDAFVDSAAFSQKGGKSSSVSRYAGSTIILNRDENELMFETGDSDKIDKLFKMGWKSFCVLDDRNKNLHLCSHIDQGLCSTIPYSYLFRNLNADTIYENIQDLEKATGGYFRRGKLKKLSSIIKKK